MDTATANDATSARAGPRGRATLLAAGLALCAVAVAAWAATGRFGAGAMAGLSAVEATALAVGTAVAVGCLWCVRSLAVAREAAVAQARAVAAALAARESEARKLSLVASRTDNAVIITDARGGIEWVNEGFTRVTGYTLPEVAGRKPGAFLQGPLTDPKTVAYMREHLRAGLGFSVEIQNYSKAGVAYWLAADIQPVHDAAGVVTNFVSIETDVTERRRVADALRASELRYRSVVDHVKEVIFQTDAAGRLTFLNKAWTEITGFAIDASLGRDASEFVHAAERAAHAGRVAAVIAGELEGFREVVRWKTTGAGGRWAEVFARPTLDDAGHIVGVSGTISDVTERKCFEDALRKAKEDAEDANRAKSEFLAKMSHEIRTPLNGVIGTAELMLATAMTGQQRRYAEVGKASAVSLLGVINDILDVSKIEAGKLELEQADFCLHAVVEDVCLMLARTAAAKGVALVAHVPPAVPTRLRGDADRVRQILINLANNAIKFTDRGEVVMTAELVARQADAVTLKLGVRDTGIGIPPDRLCRLFKPFSQVDASTTRKYGGTGLGLTICKQLAELMGGEIGVESEPGRGSTFWCTVRVAARPGGAAAAAPTTEAEPQLTASQRLVIVEPNATHRALLSDTLAGQGFAVESFAGTAEAVARLRADGAGAVDVVVLSAATGAGGLPAFVAAMAEAGAAAPAVVALVPIDEAVDHAALSAAGVAACVTTPVRYDQLRDAVLAARPGRAAQATAAPVAALTSPVAGPAAPAPRAGVAILLAEDNDVNQMVAAEVLARAGFACDVVADGRQAVEAVARKRYDLVLMDCQMPEMDGFDATRAIRSGPRANQPVVVALTANAVKGDRERCLAAGMDAYLTKPLNPKVLVDTIESLLAARVAPPTASDLVPPIDHVALLARCLGDAAFAAKVLGMFSAQVPTGLAKIEAGLAAGDLDASAKAAHAMKGSAANLSADRVRAAAAEMESLCKTNALDRAAAMLAELRAEVDRCLKYIPSLLADPGQAASGKEGVV